MEKVFYKLRYADELIEEKVIGIKLIKFLYSRCYARPFLKYIVANKITSWLYGKIMDTSFSRRYIAGFIKDNEINIDESQKNLDDFKSFNDFFSRQLKAGSRQIEASEDSIICPADGKILVYDDYDKFKTFFIKGIKYNIDNLLHDNILNKYYEKCSIVIVRLAPTDYHRFHFPADGKASTPKLIKGKYYSVSPVALFYNSNVFIENKRMITEIENEKIGSYLYIEIGATMVGSIKQTYTFDTYISKGSEKGYFEFGGSTVILIFPYGVINFDEDLIENSKNGYETKIKMGERIGRFSG